MSLGTDINFFSQRTVKVFADFRQKIYAFFICLLRWALNYSMNCVYATRNMKNIFVISTGASFPWGELSVGRTVHGANCPWGELSVGGIVRGANVRGAGCPWGELSVGRNVLGARCRGASCRGASFRGASFDGASVREPKTGLFHNA